MLLLVVSFYLIMQIFLLQECVSDWRKQIYQMDIYSEFNLGI